MAATHPFTIVVTDSLGATATQPFTLNLSLAAPTTTATITSPGYAPQVQNGGTVTYTGTVSATGGGPYTWSLVGAPAGWMVNASTGVVTSPAQTTPGSFIFTLSATDGTTTATKPIGYTVASVPVAPVAGVQALIVPAMGPFQLDKTTVLTTQIHATGVSPFTYGIGAGATTWASVSSSGLLTLNGITAPLGTQALAISVTDANGSTAVTTVSYCS